MASRKAEKERLRQERLARERELAAAARRRRLFQIYGSGAVAVLAAVVIVVVVLASGGNSSGSSNGTGNRSHSWHPVLKTAPLTGLTLKPAPPNGSPGAEFIPLGQGPPLASSATSAKGAVVDGIHCFGNEQTLFHVHTRLTVFVNGASRQIPYCIGIVPPRQLPT